MSHRLNENINNIKNDSESFLKFLKAKFPLFHNSNLFYRDFHYGLMKYLEMKEIKIKYTDAETAANDLSSHFENQGILIKTGFQSWRVNYPEFVTTTPGDPL